MKFINFLLLESLYNKDSEYIISSLIRKQNNYEEIIKKLETNLKKYKNLNNKEYIEAIEKALLFFKHNNINILSQIFDNNINQYKQSLLIYKGTIGPQINFHLTSPIKLFRPESISNIIKDLDNCIENNKLTNSIIVYRGTSLLKNAFDKMIETNELSFKTFLSSSYSIEVAKKFMNGYSEIPGKKCLFKIQCKKEQKVTFIDKINNSEIELEFLIARDSILKISNINKVKDYYHIECELVQKG